MASGSSGNCTLVSEGKTHILIDAGISARRITNGLKELGLTPAELAGIFITHEHSDHIAGLATLLKKYPVPIYATGATGRQIAYRTAGAEEHLRAVVPGRPLELGALELTAFSTPHDAADSVGYTVSDGRRRLAVVTDLGEVTPQVLQAVSGAELALLETNYEPDWLRSGPYPGYLKARILGGRGHLSNEDGAALARTLADRGTRQLVLGHLSKENNTPARALDTVCLWLGAAGFQPQKDVTVEVAPRDSLSRVYQV